MNDKEMRTPGMKRTLRVLLVASLALNLLVVGAVLGMVVSHRGKDERHPPRVSQPGGPLTAALERQDRKAVGRDLRNAMRAEQAERGDGAANFSVVISALTTDPYDSAAVRAAVEAQMQQVTRRVDLGVDILLKRFDEMSAADRAAYAERLQKVIERGPRRKPKGQRGEGKSWFGSHD